jgi:hypothetical protein
MRAIGSQGQDLMHAAWCLEIVGLEAGLAKESFGTTAASEARGQ